MSNPFFETILQRSQLSSSEIPDTESVHDFIKHLFNVLFASVSSRLTGVAEIEKEFKTLNSQLNSLVYNVTKNPLKSQQVTESYFESIPGIYHELLKDARAIAEQDPAAVSIDEVIAAYPGFYAIALYRFAHQLYLLHVPTIPRLITEYAHSQTGIDIHPGAEIGESFFIDHGTGIVIGETSVIGNNVRIFQGVTIGALLDREQVYGKRHPTIEDDVIIYAGATILGGNTIIGEGSIINGNVWLTGSVPPFSKVFQHTQVTSIESEVSPKLRYAGVIQIV